MAIDDLDFIKNVLCTTVFFKGVELVETVWYVPHFGSVGISFYSVYEFYNAVFYNVFCNVVYWYINGVFGTECIALSV